MGAIHAQSKIVVFMSKISRVICIIWVYFVCGLPMYLVVGKEFTMAKPFTVCANIEASKPGEISNKNLMKVALNSMEVKLALASPLGERAIVDALLV